MKFYIILAISIMILILGGYIVYPKASFFTYDGQNYYLTSTTDKFESKSKHTIWRKMGTSNQQYILEIENDTVYIEISYVDSSGTVNIKKESSVYTGLLDDNAVTIEQGLVKYLNLAQSFEMYTSYMNEDFAVAIYIPLSLMIICGIIYFRQSLRHILDGSKLFGYFGVMMSLILIVFPAVVNMILIYTRL